MSEYIYTPIIKDKFFNPSPVAGKIPLFADSRTNKNVIGSPLYEEWWEEQIYYLLNGYNTGGIFLPPRYYHFLNYYIIDGVGTGATYPYFVDLHKELFDFEHFEVRCDKSCAGGVMPKGRRKGLSFFGTNLIKYGSAFIDRYRAGVCAGLETYVKGFSNKLERCFNNTVPELQMNIQKFNDKEGIIGYEYRTEQGYQEEQVAYIMFQTLKNNAAKMEGEFFHDALSEESGENDVLPQAIESISHALKDGEDYVGKMWVYGTGGKMSGSGKQFSEVWHNAETYNLKRFFIPGKRYYAPAIRRPSDKYRVETPNLDKLYPNKTEAELLGCEDIIHAEELIKKRIVELSKNPDKRKLRQFLQNMPNKPEDVFISAGQNDFDSELLYQQNFIIASEGKPRWREYVLEWKKDKDGIRIEPLDVEMRPAKLEDPEWKKVYIYKEPDYRYKNLDIIGIDAYAIDKSISSKSLGGIVGIRRYDELKADMEVEEPGRVPIFVYSGRPPRKEIFWEIGLKLSVLYRTLGNTMISADVDALIGFFKANGGKKYLSPRPRLMDSKDGTMAHDWGIKITGSNGSKLTSAIQTWVIDNSQYSWFENLNTEIATSDQENIGTDWDLKDALGYALIRIDEIKKKRPPSNNEEENDTTFDYGHYDERGNYIQPCSKKDDPIQKKLEELYNSAGFF
jgi:hypothetical protein